MQNSPQLIEIVDHVAKKVPGECTTLHPADCLQLLDWLSGATADEDHVAQAALSAVWGVSSPN
jgi:hypothetical protein